MVHRLPRRVLATVLALAAAAGLATVPAAQAAPVTTAPVFGVAYGGLLSATPEELDRRLADAQALGVTSIREQLSWNAVEPSPGVYRWEAWDRLVLAASKRGISLLALVDFTPPWARVAGCDSWACAPADPQRFADFVGIAVRRYAPLGVHRWEVWNEPNSVGFWKPAPSVPAYADLLRRTTAAIRAVDPAATVVSAGLAPMPDANGNISMLRYLSALCATGALHGVDAVGLHPYSFPVLPSQSAPWNHWTQMSATAPSARSILSGCGVGSKPIWATEFGAPTNGPGAGSSTADLNLAARPDHVDEPTQARMATEAVAAAKAQPWLGAVYWYLGVDLGPLPTTNENFFGLRRYDGTAKPAWYAFRDAIAGR